VSDKDKLQYLFYSTQLYANPLPTYHEEDFTVFRISMESGLIPNNQMGDMPSVKHTWAWGMNALVGQINVFLLMADPNRFEFNITKNDATTPPLAMDLLPPVSFQNVEMAVPPHVKMNPCLMTTSYHETFGLEFQLPNSRVVRALRCCGRMSALHEMYQFIKQANKKLWSGEALTIRGSMADVYA